MSSWIVTQCVYSGHSMSTGIMEYGGNTDAVTIKKYQFGLLPLLGTELLTLLEFPER